jgi:serine/threonine protein kinase
VLIRYFDLYDIDDSAACRMDCSKLLDRLGVARSQEDTIIESPRITNLKIKCAVDMTEYRGAMVMPLYGPDLYAFGILSPCELHTLLRTLFTFASDVHRQGYCHADMKPGNIVVNNINNMGYVVVDTDNLPAAHCGGRYSTYCLPEFGEDGTYQMLFLVLLTVAYSSGALDSTDMKHFFHQDAQRTKPTKADLIQYVPVQFHYFIETIGVVPVKQSFDLLHGAIESEPYHNYEVYRK